MDRRWNLLAYDYVHNVMRSAPPGAIVIAKKDVQIFSLWHYHRVEGLRPDVRVIGQGIAHSPWYQNSAARSEKGLGIPLNPGALQELGDFKEFLSRNQGPFFATTDVDIPSGLPMGPPRGLLASLSTSTALSETPWEFIVRRGDYRYERRPDFFTSDLVDAYALSRQRLGAALIDAGKDGPARGALLSAWTMKWLLPDVPGYLGFLAYKSGDMAGTALCYEEASALNLGLIGLTEEYHSLPDLKQSIRASACDVLVNLGVAYEKMGRRDAAEEAYRRAMAVNPRAGKPHYNLAVLYWNKDWAKAAGELREALAVEPGNPDALKYLPMAEAALKASGKR
jgi:tetratricopeptide (TPR) repeat protein